MTIMEDDKKKSLIHFYDYDYDYLFIYLFYRCRGISFNKEITTRYSLLPLSEKEWNYL